MEGGACKVEFHSTRPSRLLSLTYTHLRPRIPMRTLTVSTVHLLCLCSHRCGLTSQCVAPFWWCQVGLMSILGPAAKKCVRNQKRQKLYCPGPFWAASRYCKIHLLQTKTWCSWNSSVRDCGEVLSRRKGAELCKLWYAEKQFSLKLEKIYLYPVQIAPRNCYQAATFRSAGTVIHHCQITIKAEQALFKHRLIT